MEYFVWAKISRPYNKRIKRKYQKALQIGERIVIMGCHNREKLPCFNAELELSSKLKFYNILFAKFGVNIGLLLLDFCFLIFTNGGHLFSSLYSD